MFSQMSSLSQTLSGEGVGGGGHIQVVRHISRISEIILLSEDLDKPDDV